jgi:hypothetical protein
MGEGEVRAEGNGDADETNGQFVINKWADFSWGVIERCIFLILGLLENFFHK